MERIVRRLFGTSPLSCRDEHGRADLERFAASEAKVGAPRGGDSP
ncbi:MAG: hypothetical protein ACE5FS_14660 [Paracoccaceae bacterium]